MIPSIKCLGALSSNEEVELLRIRIIVFFVMSLMNIKHKVEYLIKYVIKSPVLQTGDEGVVFQLKKAVANQR